MSTQRDGITNLPLRDRCVANSHYAVKIGDLQWVRILLGQSVVRPEAPDCRGIRSLRRVSAVDHQTFCGNERRVI